MRKGEWIRFLFDTILLKTKHNLTVSSKDSLMKQVPLKYYAHTSLMAVRFCTILLENVLTKANRNHLYVHIFWDVYNAIYIDPHTHVGVMHLENWS